MSFFKRSRRRVRATFLLQFVICAACAALFIAVLVISTTAPFKLAALVLLGVFWLVGIELGLLPEVLEWFVLRRAERSNVQRSSKWFVVLPDPPDKSASGLDE